MFSLQRLISGSDKFYDLLEASAKEVRSSASIVAEMLQTREYPNHLDQLAELRRRHKQIKWTITEELCSTFATPIEREDIENVAASLYKIPKALIKFAEGAYAGNRETLNDHFRHQTELLQRAVEIVCQMIHDLRKSPNPQKVREMNDEIQLIEGEADKRMTEVNRELYSGKFDPITVILLKDINALMEKAIDRCRDTGNVLFQVTLKYS